MGVEENDDKTINFLEKQPEAAEEEQIEQVYSQEPEDVKAVDEPSIESEEIKKGLKKLQNLKKI